MSISRHSNTKGTRRLPRALALPVLASGLAGACLADPDSDAALEGSEVAADTAPATGADEQAEDDGTAETTESAPFEYRSLDGSGNNLDDPTLGQANSIYTRVTEANYADGIGELEDRPDERYLSNRIFNDSNQNVFSENGVTHWSFVWGQFLDHTIGNRLTSDEELVIAFDPDDPLEEFTNDLGGITTSRSAAAEGTGVDTPREQVNTISSYIDAWAIYGGAAERLDWLREGSLDGDPTNNSATLLNDDGHLPSVTARADAEAPDTDLMGRLFADPTAAVVAGDVRVNENIGLTAVQTLFLREHNRIVDELPDDLDEETKFQIARRVVSGLQQWITYNEFLPAMGVELDSYEGYDPTVDPTITNEFATVGYRAHSQIHGEYEAEIALDTATEDRLAALEQGGVSVELDSEAGVAEVAIPLNVAFGNPELLPEIGLGNFLTGLSSEAAYANDEQIDNQLRSVLFQIPGPDAENPLDCLDGSAIAECFSGVNDLGSIDVLRSHDHGMPSYNELRLAYGLDPVGSFTELTGEDTDEFPRDPSIDRRAAIDDPDILDFVLLEDADGNVRRAGHSRVRTPPRLLSVLPTRRGPGKAGVRTWLVDRGRHRRAAWGNGRGDQRPPRRCPSRLSYPTRVNDRGRLEPGVMSYVNPSGFGGRGHNRRR